MWLLRPRLSDLACAAAAGLEGADAVPAAVGHWLVLIAASAQIGDEAARQSPTLLQRQRPSSAAYMTSYVRLIRT